MFDPEVMRATHPGVQAAAEQAGRPATEAVSSATRAAEYELRTQLDAMLRQLQGGPRCRERGRCA
jgi:hypothetical protein